MNKLIQSLKNGYQKIGQIFGQLLFALGYVYELLLRAGNALYQVVKNDLLHLHGKVWGSRAEIKGHSTDAVGIAKEQSKIWLSRLKPQYWVPLIVSQYKHLKSVSEKEWSAFSEDIRNLIDRLKQIRNPSDAQRSVGLLSPFDGERTTVIAASIVINLLALAFPLLMLQLYDRILPHQSLDTLGIVAVAVGLAVALESIVRALRSFTTAWISARFEHRALMAVAERTLAEPINEFERKGTGTVMDGFKSVSTLKYHYSGQTFQQLMDLPFTLLYVLIVFILSPWVGLLLLAGYSVFIFITWRNGRQDPELIKEQKQADLRRANFLSETLGNVHTLKSMTMESLMLRRYERLQEGCARIMSKVTYALDMSSGIGNIFSPLMNMLVVALGAWLVITGHLTNGELAACILLGMRSLAPLQRLGGMWAKYQQDEVLRDNLADILKQPGLEVQPRSYDLVPTVVDRPLQPASLKFENVSYRFPGLKTNLFTDLSFEVAPGECLAIKGESGSGRSTLLQLMAGILTPTSGVVSIDAQSIMDIDVNDITEKVAYLPQKAVMFEGSLLDNVSVFDPARVERALSTAKTLGLGDFVSKMPRGWDSIVGDMAADSLPPGYRQRIAIVRALSNQPNIILFDDATSVMDSEGDAVFLKFLEAIRGKVTLVIVSQRPSFLRLANRTMFLHEGNLLDVEPGKVSSIREASSAPTPVAGMTSSQALPASYHPVSKEEYFTSPYKSSYLDKDRWKKTNETVASNFKVQTDLSGCLSLLLRLMNARGTSREVAEALPYYADSLDLTGFHNAFSQLGYVTKEVECDLGSLEPRSLPCLFVPDEDIPAFVVMGRIGNQMRVGVTQDSEGKLEPRLDMRGKAYFYDLAEIDLADQRSWVGRVLRRFMPLIGQATLSALVSGLVMMSGPIFLSIVYTHVIPAGAKATLLYLAIGAAIALGAGYYFMKHRANILAYIAGRIEYLFGATILQQVLKMSPAYTERASVGSQTARLQSFEAIRDMFTGPLASTLLESPATLVLLIVLSIINPISLIIFVVMLAVYALLYWIFAGQTHDRVAAVGRAITKRNEFMVEMIGKMRIIHECGAQGLWLERFREISANATMASYKAEQLSSLLVAISYFVMMASALLIISATVPAVIMQVVSSGALIASMLLMWRVLNPIQTIFTNMTRIERVRNATRQIDSLMKIQGERQETNTSLVSRGLEGRIDFARVSFRYSMNVDPALIGVEFRINPGDLVAISGPNGGGKSTLLKLILGMYQPQAGSILIDNVDIRQLDPLELRRIVGYAPQDTQLFRATIAQNLRLARPDATDDEVYQALEMAGAIDQILALPKGIEYRVGDNTNELPSSLKQKLSLARAYLTRAPIMLFDEPGAGLDDYGDQKFMEALQALKGKATVLFISHRPSHIRLADTLLVLDKGYLRAAGPPDVLLKQPTAA
ncbi:peptidase domain-containing ABC transporter [Polynucleobacter sp. MWH-Braz-FAM2G]|uniref:peptidase domain-containing ABC transporter n=1 Tax=Polynucleobacter sp. MWH-Braz-FAM2G TaxID=1855883 RepID=UPI001BFE6E89|nr:ATP-binding cassette domain-containing protein [Polynucleobacter sp. MWH-Braz-FAM2G]QWD89970.1 ATP-binding cassette domain-containing protein [Polynucleobacter sp. MWH-Braz-FAM2G]